MVERSIIQTVLRKFLTAPRHPKFMDKPKYKDYPPERNKEIYMTSCYFQDSELYEQAQAYTAAFLDDTKKYWIVGLPYQVSIKEGLLSKEQVLDEVSESTFSDISWMMEMECLFYGCGDDALFSYSTLLSRRRLNESFYPLEEYRNKNLKVPDLAKGEERILAVDVALMASRRHANDASALTILSCLPTENGDYVCNVPYLETKEGLTVDDLGLLVMRFFYQYKCTQLCVDGAGVGQAIVDFCLTDRFDPMYNQTYPAISCCNNSDIESRCKVRNAQKALWVIKANASTNNDMYLALRSAFMNGNINLLIAENNAEEFIKKHVKGFSRMSAQEQAMYRIPYLQTTLLIEELAKLEHENKNGNIKVKERPGMRKDRVSSLLYGYYVCQQLSYKKKRIVDTSSLVDRLPIKQGKRFSMFN